MKKIDGNRTEKAKKHSKNENLKLKFYKNQLKKEDELKCCCFATVLF